MFKGMFKGKPKQNPKKTQAPTNKKLVIRDINTGMAVEHIPPNAEVHIGPSKKITICSKCNRTAMASMQSDIKACPSCKGKVIRGTGYRLDELVEFTARWDGSMWKFLPDSPIPPYMNPNAKYTRYI